MARDTRDKILRAGLRLFSQKGYLGATTKEIAQKAGVAELTLFRHFSSKEKLFEEMMEGYSFLPTLKGILPELRELEHRDALTEIARRFLERLIERRLLIRIMQAEIDLYPAKVREVYQHVVGEIMKTLASYFVELQEQGVLRDFDPLLGARAFLGMFYSYFNAQELTAARKNRFSDMDRIVKEYVRIFLMGTLRNVPERTK